MFSEILTLDDIKKEPFIVEHILWDMCPKDLMEPRFPNAEEGARRAPIKGYIFYIETMDAIPSLFLMRHTSAEYAETLAKIDEVPQELLQEALEENKDRAYFKMYPITKKIEAWLKQALGIV